MELQKKSIDALLESMAILRQELQNNQDSEKEIELLGELKLLSARIYIESDLTVMSMLPEMKEDLPDSLGELEGESEDLEGSEDLPMGEETDEWGFDFGTADTNKTATDFEDADLEAAIGESLEAKLLDEESFEEERLDEELYEAENPEEFKMADDEEELLVDDAVVNVAEEASSELEIPTVISSKVEDVVSKENEVDLVSKEEIPLQQDLFFAAVPVLGGQKNSNTIQNEVAKNANEEDAVAKIANIDFDSPEFKLPEFELPEFELPEFLPTDAVISQPIPVEVVSPATEVIPPVAEVISTPPVEVVPPMAEVLPPAVEVTQQIPVEVIPPMAEAVLPVAEEVPPVAEVVSPPPVEVVPAVTEVVPAVTEVVPPIIVATPPVENTPPPISAINTITESPIDSSSSVQLNENGELPPPALSGMNVEAIVNQMPISRRFEFANLLFGGDIQRMGTFIHELLQAPTGSGRMDVYERWYDENNWRRRDEAASDMLRLIKRIFPS